MSRVQRFIETEDLTHEDVLEASSALEHVTLSMKRGKATDLLELVAEWLGEEAEGLPTRADKDREEREDMAYTVRKESLKALGYSQG